MRVDADEPAELYGQLGRAAARHLTETVSVTTFLGFDTGRTVSHIADHLETLPACDVVQLSGLAGTVQLNGLDILRRVIDVSGGTAHPLYAPMIANDAAAAAAYRQQPEVSSTMKRYRHLTTAIVSVGSWDPPVSQVYDRLTNPERHTMLKAGVIAKTCALTFDHDGAPVQALDDRRIGIPLAELQAVPNVIAVAGGQDKTAAIQALLRSGVVNTMITDVGTAERLLTSRESPPDRAEGSTRRLYGRPSTEAERWANRGSGRAAARSSVGDRLTHSPWSWVGVSHVALSRRLLRTLQDRLLFAVRNRLGVAACMAPRAR